jgi:hypothetical protein
LASSDDLRVRERERDGRDSPDSLDAGALAAGFVAAAPGACGRRPFVPEGICSSAYRCGEDE